MTTPLRWRSCISVSGRQMDCRTTGFRRGSEGGGNSQAGR